jgi:hypothetical protein
MEPDYRVNDLVRVGCSSENLPFVFLQRTELIVDVAGVLGNVRRDSQLYMNGRAYVELPRNGVGGSVGPDDSPELANTPPGRAPIGAGRGSAPFNNYRLKAGRIRCD